LHYNITHFVVSSAADASDTPYFYYLSVSPLPSFVIYLHFIYCSSSNFVVDGDDDDDDDITICWIGLLLLPRMTLIILLLLLLLFYHLSAATPIRMVLV